jgi:hypothetical protein
MTITATRHPRESRGAGLEGGPFGKLSLDELFAAARQAYGHLPPP